MFWIVILIIAGLAGFTTGWITLHRTGERIVISFEVAKVSPAVKKLRQTAVQMLNRGRRHFEKSHRP